MQTVELPQENLLGVLHAAPILVDRECYETVRCVDSDAADCIHLGDTAHGTPVDITRAVAEADFRICLGNIEFHYFAGYSGGAKAIIICNPSNPSGKVFTEEELKTIADLCIRYDVYAIMDEVYEHIIYDGRKHIYMNSIPGMWERTVSCSSLSKTYSITGWRLGYIIAPPEIIDRAKKVHDFLTVGAAAPLQEAIIPGLNFGQDYYDALQAEYTHKKDLFLKGLDDLKIVHNDPEGAYYVMLDISEFGYESDLQFCEDLASKVGVGAVPGSSFFREPVNHLIRLHFARSEETLNEALERLAKLPKLV